MGNLFDYLKWRGDLSFERDSFNEVDNLLLSQLIYLPLENIVSKEFGGKGIALSALEAELVAHRTHGFAKTRDQKTIQLNKLLLLAANTKRFGNVTISGFRSILDPELSEQFCAGVFSLSSSLHYVAFRGTGDTLIGWKEDFMMSFRKEVPAQHRAVGYANEALSKLKGRFIFGGHSKGGNLAVYAAMNLKRSYQRKIIAVYNNDGPGFQPDVLATEGYRNLREKINTYMPQSSIVGIMLEHSEDYSVVSSTSSGAKQHKALSWEVIGTHFSYEKELTKNSRTLDVTLRSWLGQIPDEQKEQFIDAVFEILKKTGAQTLTELSERRLKKADLIIKTYKTLDVQTQALLKNVIVMFFKEKKKIQKELTAKRSTHAATIKKQV